MKGFTLLCEASVQKLYRDHAGHRKALTGPSDRGQSVAGIVSHGGLAVLRFVPTKDSYWAPSAATCEHSPAAANPLSGFEHWFPS